VLSYVSSEDLSFVIGAFLGDGSFVEDSAWHHHVKISVRDREFAEKFNRSVASVLARKVNAITITHDLGKIYYDSKYSSRPLGLFLKGPLDQLSAVAHQYPNAFLCGLFSADGCAAVSGRETGLAVSIVLTNSRLELLSLVDELLRTHFDIQSRTYLARKKGATWSLGKKTVVLRKDSYNLWISRKQDVKNFVNTIGFVIRRKQEAAEKAIHLIETVGRSRACELWKLNRKC